jgi:hypothetical protein
MWPISPSIPHHFPSTLRITKAFLIHSHMFPTRLPQNWRLFEINLSENGGDMASGFNLALNHTYLHVFWTDFPQIRRQGSLTTISTNICRLQKILALSKSRMSHGRYHLGETSPSSNPRDLFGLLADFIWMFATTYIICECYFCLIHVLKLPPRHSMFVWHYSSSSWTVAPFKVELWDINDTLCKTLHLEFDANWTDTCRVSEGEGKSARNDIFDLGFLYFSSESTWSPLQACIGCLINPRYS